MGMTLDITAGIILVIYTLFLFFTGYLVGGREKMNNCERCCFFEACTRLARIENKNCVYGNKADKDKGESHEEKDSSALQ